MNIFSNRDVSGINIHAMKKQDKLDNINPSSYAANILKYEEVPDDT